METVSKFEARYIGRYRGTLPPSGLLSLSEKPPLTNNKRILIIDDDPFFRSLAKVLLLQTGLPIVEIFEAEDSREAFAEIQKHDIDLVLCDLNLPRNFSQNGIEIVRRIRAIRPNLPTYMVTAENNADTVEAVRQAGASGHILKPMNLRILRRIVASTFFPGLKAGLESVRHESG